MKKFKKVKQYLSADFVDGVTESISLPNMFNTSTEEEEADTSDSNWEDAGIMDTGGDDTPTEPDDAGSENDTSEEDPNKQGVIRVVKGAHLVYKRQDDNGLYDELWIFQIDSGIRDELDIKRNILAGTDIPEGKMQTKDGKQSYVLWTAGNAQLLKISGLPN